MNTAEKPRPESIISIVNAKYADIGQVDQTIIHEAVGVTMALDRLRESFNFALTPVITQQDTFLQVGDEAAHGL